MFLSKTIQLSKQIIKLFLLENLTHNKYKA